MVIAVLAVQMWSVSLSIAQEAVPAAAAAPAAPPVAKLESDDPAVQALLNTKPSTPKDLFEVTGLLLELEQPELARAMLVKLIETATAPEQLVEVGRTFGKREVLRLGEIAGLQPEGKPFAEKILAAMNAADRDPARIASLIQQLQDPSFDVRVAAINNLRAGGEAALQTLVEGVLDPNRVAEHKMLLTALAGFGEPALGPARAMIASGDETASLAGIQTLSLLEGRDATLDLYAAAYGESLPPSAGQAARAASAKRSATVQPAEIAVQLYLAAEGLYQRQVVDQPQPTTTWQWNAAEKKPTSALLPRQVDDHRRAARYADAAANITGEIVARRLALVALLESAIAAEPDPTKWNAVAQAVAAARKPTLPDWEAAYAQAIELDRSMVAALCLEQIAASGNAESLLLTPSGRTTTLVQAALSDEPTVRFVAVEAVLKLKPTIAFPGSSGVAQSLAWLASSDGAEQALVVDAHVERGRNFAAMLSEMKLRAEAVHTVRAGLESAATQADVQVIFVDRSLLEPTAGSFLANLRRDYRSARIPVVVVCEPEELDRTRTRWYADPYTFAIIRPRDGATLMTQMAMIPNLGQKSYVIPPERQRRAVWALNAIRALLETKNPVFDLRPYEAMLLQAANSPTRGLAAVGVLGAFGSPGAQRTSANVASESARPLELRQAAAAAFAENVKRYGKLLTTEQISLQYDRYNASETLDKPTQQLLASMLDALEGKPPAPAAEPVPAAPATTPVPTPATAPAPAAAPSPAAP